MGNYKYRKTVLCTTVSLLAIIFSSMAFQGAVSGENIEYTGTQAEYDALVPAGEIRPTGSGNTVSVSDPGNLGVNFYDLNAVYGGYGYGTGYISISDNSVIISGGTINGTVFGGYGSGYGDTSISDNSVVISGGTINGTVFGGYGSGNGAGSVSDSSVVISGGTINGTVFGGYSSNASDTSISDSKVVISDGAIDDDVYGGIGFGYGYSAVSVSDNSVFISGGTIGGDVYGGDGFGFGAISVSDNSVFISDGTIGGDVYGGSGSGSDDVLIFDNSVFISGGTISGDVYGGYGGLKIINNTVTLEDGARIEGSVYGGYAKDSSGDEITEFNSVISGNTLNLNSYSGSVAGIYNFENYNWILPKNIVNGDVLITITGSTPVDLTNTIHTVAIENDSKRLNVGDQIVMIDKAAGDPSLTPIKVPSELQQGHFIIYDVEMKVDDDDKFVLNIKGDDTTPEEAGRINPRTKALSEGRAAALGFVSQGSDLIATAGIDNVRVMVRSTDNTENHIPFLPFLITKGASNRYNTGSHAKVNGFQMAVGIASGAELEQGHKMTLGAFFEYGRGTYNTYNSFANYASVRGDGDTHYTGGGIFGRFDFANTGLGLVNDLAPTQADGLYLEASLRAGRVSMGFDSADLIDPEGYRGNYNSKSNYWGGHAAAGYVFNFDERQALDIYGRYLWTHMKGDSVTIGKDRLHFDSASSNRMQLGGRYNYTYNGQFKPYIGAAYEYEFSGDIGAHAYKIRLDEPSLKGSTGIVEAGFSFMPSAKAPDFSINVTGQAYFGQRRGGSGEIKLKYQF